MSGLLRATKPVLRRPVCLPGLAGSTCSLGQTPPGARGLGGQVVNGGPPKRLALIEGRACQGLGIWPFSREAPDSCLEYFDKNTLNTWCMFRLKQAGPAPHNALTHGHVPEKPACAPTQAHRGTGQALTPAPPGMPPQPLL